MWTVNAGALHGKEPRTATWRHQKAFVAKSSTDLRTEMMPNGMNCAYVSRQDLLFLFREVYDNEAYLRNGVELNQGDTVLVRKIYHHVLRADVDMVFLLAP